MEIHDFHGNHINTESVRRELENIGDFQVLSDIFRQLGDTSRLRIFWLLCHCEECVINISSLVNMTSPAVSHHLKALKSGGLITGRRKGKEVLYRASDSQQSRLLHTMIEQSMEISCPKTREGYRSQQLSLIDDIHAYLVENIDRKITIDELAAEFAINTTTLKEMFKSVYGTSIAAHIKEHRMKLASELLCETDLSIGEIASEVGFESRSRTCSISSVPTM